jgi:hypothetical protein
MKVRELSLLIFMYSVFKTDKLVSQSKLVFIINYWITACDSENFILELTEEINEPLRPLYSTYIYHMTQVGTVEKLCVPLCILEVPNSILDTGATYTD